MRRASDAYRTVQGPLSLVVVLGLLAGCAAPFDHEPDREETAADRQAVIDAHRALVQAYESGDAGAYVDMLEPSPAPLIFHPRLDNRFDGIEEVSECLGNMFARLGQSTWEEAHSEVSVKGDVAWLTTHVVIESSNLEQPFVGRGTEVWVRSGPRWRLTHGHWSPNPEAAWTGAVPAVLVGDTEEE